MEKQHNRGQDGAGLANIKLDVAPGQRYISRLRSNSNKPIQDVFQQVNQRFEKLQEKDPAKIDDVEYLKANFGFTGELFLGHLRYGTFGKNSVESCHPFLRQSNWMTRNLVVAGNFNLTNVDELFGQLVDLGQHPKEQADTVTVLEKIGHFLDEENERLFKLYKGMGYSNEKITHQIAENLDLPDILRKSAANGMVDTPWPGSSDTEMPSSCVTQVAFALHIGMKTMKSRLSLQNVRSFKPLSTCLKKRW